MSENNKTLEEFIKSIEETITDEDLKHWTNIRDLQEKLGSKYKPKGWFTKHCPNCNTSITKPKNIGTRIIELKSDYYNSPNYKLRRTHFIESCTNCDYEYVSCHNSPI